ncbi:MAG: hypothetical protein R3313_00825 [Candidatus Saccharimonadales bacterium]|nr:hypothetical protein [Candidatus Saccharimonadales bacterium]
MDDKKKPDEMESVPNTEAGGDPPPESPTEETNNQPMPDSETPLSPAQGDQPAPSEMKGMGGFKALLSNKKVLLVVLLVVVGAVVALVLVLGSGDNSASDDGTDQSAQANEETNQDTSEEADEATPSSTIAVKSFLSKYEDLGYVEGVFSKKGQAFVDTHGWGEDGPEDAVPTDRVKFYKAGTTEDGKDIIIVSNEYEGLGPYYENGVLLKDGSNWTLLKQNSKDLYQEGIYSSYALSDNVTVDETSLIDEFVVQTTITINGAAISSFGSWSVPTYEGGGNTPYELKDHDVLEETEYGTMYEKIYPETTDNGIKNYTLVLRQKSGALVGYDYALSGFNDDGSLAINWKDGTSTSDVYSWYGIHRGCGAAGVNVLSKDFHKDLVERGTDSSGRTVYELSSPNVLPFKDYIDGRNEMAAGSDYADEVSLQTAYDEHAMVFVKNELNYYVALLNEKYGSLAECAKPVIYLYPEAATSIDVVVGADVTKSDPFYGEGWYNVAALPSGQLFYNGQGYDSLFWDGTGHGRYPVVDSGFIVPNDQVEATLWTHLDKLGLNQEESEDFMEYWLPLMPDDPYVRLTWFDTPMMEKLAPLYLSQQPDTLIRIFLDFEGLDQPVELPVQKLYSPERNDFTVVEWGGLLIGGGN